MAHQAGAYPGFFSMKRLGVFLLSPGWDASPSHGYPQHWIRRYPFIHLGVERHWESKVSCPRTWHNDPGQGSNPDRPLDPETSALTMRSQAPPIWGMYLVLKWIVISKPRLSKLDLLQINPAYRLYIYIHTYLNFGSREFWTVSWISVGIC